MTGEKQYFEALNNASSDVAKVFGKIKVVSEKVTAKHIQDITGKTMVMRGHSPVCSNLTYFTTWNGKMYECDLLSATSSGFVYEFEVKINKQDFNNDFIKKKDKHEGYLNFKDYIIKHNTITPNYFAYVCPPGLIKGHEVPSYAGLYYCEGDKLTEVIKPPRLHSEKHNLLKLMTKICRVQAERLYLGACKLTYLNNNIKSRNKTILEKAGFPAEMMKGYKK